MSQIRLVRLLSRSIFPELTRDFFGYLGHLWSFRDSKMMLIVKQLELTAAATTVAVWDGTTVERGHSSFQRLVLYSRQPCWFLLSIEDSLVYLLSFDFWKRDKNCVSMNQRKNKKIAILSDWYTCSNWIGQLLVDPENRSLKNKEPSKNSQFRVHGLIQSWSVLRKLATWDTSTSRVIQTMIVFFLATLVRHPGMLNSHAEKPIPWRSRFHGGEPLSEESRAAFVLLSV